MLPSNLLIARIRRGQVRPVYARLEDANLEVARSLIGLYEEGIGRSKGQIAEEIKGYEGMGYDYRFVRGLSVLLERRCSFVAKSSISSTNIRRLVFQEASKHGMAPSPPGRAHIMAKAAEELGITSDEVEELLFADLDEQSILKEFKPVGPEDLLRQYNLSLTQTLLFRSTSLKFTARSNWKRIFRRIKWLGLIYSAEAVSEGFWVDVDGPLSLFRLTERYGTSLAKLLPEIVGSEGWQIEASVVRGGDDGGGRVLKLELSNEEVGPLLKHPPTPPLEAFDSSVEEKFSRSFHSLGTGWRLAREPEPLIAGNHVFIPDFGFEKEGAKVYMEIVGFWTQEYLERKVQKLQQLRGVDLILAVNENLVCSKLKRVGGSIIYYRKAVPAGRVLDLLGEYEQRDLARQVANARDREIKLEGEIMELKEMAKGLGISQEALKRVLAERICPGYRLVGDILISEAKLKKIAAALATLQEKTWSKAVELIQGEGVGFPDLILRALGYTIKLHGMDMEKATFQGVSKD
jgi:predicted nuclease of restriction endonuclease-like RecB superfamily